MMRLCQVLLVIVICLCMTAWACEQKHNGCKISGNNCVCGLGCKSEYMYNTKRACRKVLSATPAPTLGQISNICSRTPCLRGNCIQTTNDIGYTCKCEGTGFYGQRCEKACPTLPMRGMVFPHECIVI